MKRYKVETLEDGSKLWYYNNQLHREDGPAVKWSDGTKIWYQNGLRHRTDGPAFEKLDGTKLWYQNDKLHRTDGPAIELADGRKEYRFHGRKISYMEFLLDQILKYVVIAIICIIIFL